MASGSNIKAVNRALNTKRKKLWRRFRDDIYYKGLFTRMEIALCLIANWDISYRSVYVKRVGDSTRSNHSWRKLTQILWIRFGYVFNKIPVFKRMGFLWKILRGNKPYQIYLFIFDLILVILIAFSRLYIIRNIK